MEQKFLEINDFIINVNFISKIHKLTLNDSHTIQITFNNGQWISCEFQDEQARNHEWERISTLLK